MSKIRKSLQIGFVFCMLLVGLNMPSGIRQTDANGGNLLTNGSFDEEDPETHGFKWFPPNHFVALHWHRWWINAWPSDPLIPEYDDMRPGGRWPPVDGDHAQVYFKWGHTYTAGIYQVVEGLTPCQPYELRMYARSEGVNGTVPHARIGLDPEGAALTLSDDVNDLLTMPEHTVWSEEQTQLNTWEQLNVTAEPVANSLTAILYASPTYAGAQTPYYDTFWDAGTLQATTYENGWLPIPTNVTPGFISNVTIFTTTGSIMVTWDTQATASTQVWYSHAIPQTITPTITLSNTLYMPLVSRTTFDYDAATTLDLTPATFHQATISGLTAGEEVHFIVLSRHSTGDACVTEYAGPYVSLQP